ncbi:hypothetical protein [Salipiger bermudensis]|uniref:hypothetical protein n=1 Tax=Salipiger bermudensis TaxID=344736 RepID=UPI001CD39681|nr:hypothetical protein [Salipiger bermudensis]MCA0962946.1 hypothetical protein [Salipiger bermudensis]
MSLPPPLSHPGPRAKARAVSLPCYAEPVTLSLEAGIPLDRAIVDAAAKAGFEAAYLRLPAAELARLAYVIPTPAPGDGRAAWYSATHVLQPGRLIEAGLHLGRKDGAPFLHCHGLWAGEDGVCRMGHLLAPDSVLAETVVAEGWGLSGARFEVRPDAETGFDLFTPVPHGRPKREPNALLCKLAPNEDPHALLAEAARAMPGARIEGIGSLIATRFEGAAQDSYATEVLLHDGQISDGAVRLEASSVGFDGVPLSGTLQSGANRICITAELLLLAP